MRSHHGASVYHGDTWWTTLERSEPAQRASTQPDKGQLEYVDRLALTGALRSDCVRVVMAWSSDLSWASAAVNVSVLDTHGFSSPHL